jgi:hypothetical protein
MEDVPDPRPKSCFMIDLSKEKVFCRMCRKVTVSLDLLDYTLYWCKNRVCDNTQEVRRYPDGTWKIFDFIEIWDASSRSEILNELVMLIKSGARRE